MGTVFLSPGGPTLGGRLPSGYREVQYIKATGTQYIDTGFKPNGNTRVVGKYDLTGSTTEDAIFFTRNGSYNTPCYALFQGDGNTLTDDYGTANDYRISFSITNKLVVFDKNKNTTAINGVSKTHQKVNRNFQLLYSLAIFGRMQGGTIVRFSVGTLYYLKVYDNGTLIRDFVPCKVKKTGRVGLYDLANNKFYGNPGTENFVPGPEV